MTVKPKSDERPLAPNDIRTAVEHFSEGYSSKDAVASVNPALAKKTRDAINARMDKKIGAWKEDKSRQPFHARDNASRVLAKLTEFVENIASAIEEVCSS